MKYIKKFKINESILNIQEKRNEIKNFCEEHIPYLLDDDVYSINVISSMVDKTNNVAGNKFNIIFRCRFTGSVTTPTRVVWADVKDNIIPLIDFIRSEYTLLNIVFFDKLRTEYTFDELENSFVDVFRLLVITIEYDNEATYN